MSKPEGKRVKIEKVFISSVERERWITAERDFFSVKSKWHKIWAPILRLETVIFPEFSVSKCKFVAWRLISTRKKWQKSYLSCLNLTRKLSRRLSGEFFKMAASVAGRANWRRQNLDSATLLHTGQKVIILISLLLFTY